MTIKVKFIIPSDGNLQLIQQLALTSLRETFAADISEQQLNQHLQENYNAHSLVSLLNDFNNKCLFAYVQDKLAGYAIFSSFCQPPAFVGQRKGMEVTDLQVPEQLNDPGVKEALLLRCLQQADPDTPVWSLQPKNSSTVSIFLNHGFQIRHETETVNGLATAGVYLVREP